MKIEYLRNTVVFNLCRSDVYRKNLVFNLWERLPAANIANTLLTRLIETDSRSQINDGAKRHPQIFNLQSSIVNNQLRLGRILVVALEPLAQTWYFKMW
jgi:hypothetical protein